MSNKEKKIKAEKVIEELWRLYPEAQCTLDYKEEPWKLLVAGILSAQCTDARVNIITPVLFKKYPTISELAQAQLEDIQQIIRSCGFFRVKSDSIKRTMNMILEDFNETVPKTLEELILLPGVGRKIANLILGDTYGIPSIVVDTHCSRVSHHIGFTDSKDPYKIEKDLSKILPKNTWIGYGHRMVAHGRAICVARNPKCVQCTLNKICRKGIKVIESIK